MEEEFEDRPYDVVSVRSLLANQYLPDQAEEIRNADAPWFLTGITARQTAGGGYPNIRVKDYTSRAISTDPERLTCAASDEQAAPVGSNTYLQWPRNSPLRYDLQETGGDVCTIHILFRGFKRYRKGEAPCR